MMHTVKKDELQKKICYRDRKLETTTLTPPRQHQKISFSISDVSKKETMHKLLGLKLPAPFFYLELPLNSHRNSNGETSVWALAASHSQAFLNSLISPLNMMSTWL
jgi:hypothetical protein